MFGRILKAKQKWKIQPSPSMARGPNNKQRKTSPNNLPALLLALLVVGDSPRLRAAHPHCARPRILEYSVSLYWAGATSQVGNVRRNPRSP